MNVLLLMTDTITSKNINFRPEWPCMGVLNGPACVPPMEAAVHTMLMVRILAYPQALDNSCIVDRIQRFQLCGCRQQVASWTPDVPRRPPLLAAVSGARSARVSIIAKRVIR
jgi:hypothetical protein